MAKYCANCGKALPDGVELCPDCGGAATEDGAALFTRMTAETEGWKTAEEREKKERPKLTLSQKQLAAYIGAAVAVVALAVCLILYIQPSNRVIRAVGAGEYDRALELYWGNTRLASGEQDASIQRAAKKAAGQVVEAVKAGAIRHFFLVGGCDGIRSGRDYYTEFVKKTPADTVVLTLGCGKYRFNDLDLGTIGGLPRLMDMGQCNDAYSAIQVAVALANAFDCGVNELPLSLVLSWYEQKAVSILLTLLHLGIKNIRLGPTLPAFVSPNVLSFLVEQYNIAPITTPDEDMKEILG